MEEEFVNRWKALGKFALLAATVVYLGVAIHLSWNLSGKGSHIKFDPAMESKSQAADCPRQMKKYIVPSARKYPNPWLLQTKEEGGLYVDALKEKPECLGIIAAGLLPSGRSGYADHINYYYDHGNGSPVIKITVEYLR